MPSILRPLTLLLALLGGFPEAHSVRSQQDPPATPLPDLPAELTRTFQAVRAAGQDRNALRAAIDEASDVLAKLTARQRFEHRRTIINLVQAAIAARELATGRTWLRDQRDALTGRETDAAGALAYLMHAEGLAFFHERDYANATLCWQQALPTYLAEFGEADARVALLHRQIGHALRRQQRFTEARPHMEAAVAVSRTGGGIQAARDLEALGYVCHFCRDRQAAFDAYDERLRLVLDLRPADDAEVLAARQNLSTALMALGDYAGAFAQSSEVLAIRERTLPPLASGRLASMIENGMLLLQLGDEESSERLVQSAVDRLQDPTVALDDQRRGLLAEGLQHLAQLAAGSENARCFELAEAALTHHAALRGDDDFWCAKCRLIMATAARHLGNLEQARQLLERAAAQFEQLVPDDYNEAQIAWGELAIVNRLLGDRERAVAATERTLTAARSALAQCTLAARPSAQLARLQRLAINDALTLAFELDEGPLRQQLLRRALALSQWIRGIELRVARAGRQARTIGTDDRVEQRLVEIAQALRDATRSPDQDERAMHLVASLTREKERLERARTSAPVPLPTAGELAAQLGDHEVAVVAAHFVNWVAQPNRRDVDGIGWLAVLTLRSSGQVTLVDLGPYDEVLALVDHLDPLGRRALGKHLAEPLLRATDGARTAWLATHELLHRVPLDSLPVPGGLLGAKLELRRVDSLVDLLDEPAEFPDTAPILAAIGAIDYGEPSPSGSPPSGSEQRDEVAAPEATAEAQAASLLRSGRRPFASLPGAALELDTLQAAFARQFPAGTARVLRGESATPEAVRTAMHGAHLIHFATHGFAGSNPVAGETDPFAALVAHLSPFTLCGLALSRANTDDRGVLLGEQLMQFDATDCHLAFVSACDSAAGTLRRGQGYASLHAALHAAGARFVVSSLWPIGDREAQFLTAAFYRELLTAPARPHRALWRARLAGRAAGLPFESWAAFTISGR